MDEELLEKTLNITKTKRLAVWVHTRRYTSPSSRCGYASVVCTEDGKLTRIIHSLNNYTNLKNLVRIEPNYFYIQARKDFNQSIVEIYKVKEIDKENKKVILKKVATFKDNKWDDSSYVSTLKRGIHSALMRAKKYYNLLDI